MFNMPCSLSSSYSSAGLRAKDPRVEIYEALEAIVRSCSDFQINGDSLIFLGKKNLSDIFQGLEELLQREHYIDLANEDQEDWKDVIQVAKQKSDPSTWTNPIVINDLVRMTLYRMYHHRYSVGIRSNRAKQDRIGRTEFEQEISHIEEMFRRFQDHHATIDSKCRDLAKDGALIARKQKQHEESIESLEVRAGQTREDLSSFMSFVQKEVRKLSDCVTNLFVSFEVLKLGHEAYAERLGKLDRSLFHLKLPAQSQREFLGVMYDGRVPEERPPPYWGRLRVDPICEAKAVRTAIDEPMRHTHDHTQLTNSSIHDWKKRLREAAKVDASGRGQEGGAAGEDSSKGTKILTGPESAEENGLQAISAQKADGEIWDQSNSLERELQRELEKSRVLGEEFVERSGGDALGEAGYVGNPEGDTAGDEGKLLATVADMTCLEKAAELVCAHMGGQAVSATLPAPDKFAGAENMGPIRLNEQNAVGLEEAVRRDRGNSDVLAFMGVLGSEWVLRTVIFFVRVYIRGFTPSLRSNTRGIGVFLCLSLLGTFAALHQVLRNILAPTLGSPLPLSSIYEGSPIELNIYGPDIYAG